MPKITKLVLKRMLIWLCESCLELVLLGLALIGLFGYEKHSFGGDLELSVSVWLLGLLVSGYFVTTFFVRTLWKGQRWWSYSVVTVALFFVHTQIAFVLFHVSTWSDRLSMQMPGALVIFGCTATGTLVLRKLAPQRETSASMRDAV